MKAIRVHVFGEPEVLQIEETPIPEVGANEVLIRVKAIGINPVDTYIRAGVYARKPVLPYTPGTDAAGIVEIVGKNVNNFKTGDRVYTSGAISGVYAEFALCREQNVHSLPENTSFEQGAGVFVPYATAFRGLFQKAKPVRGETVLIHGASGGVGIAAVQLAKAAGLQIIGTASTAKGLELVKNEGADFALNHSSPDYLNEIMQITDGKGVNIVLEMLANVNLQKDLDILAMFGRVVVIGNRGSLEFNPRGTMGKDATIFGLSLFNAPPDAMREIHNELYKGLQENTLRPIIGKTFALADAAKAHREVIESKAFGKIILIP